jgi:hypothetical protein
MPTVTPIPPTKATQATNRLKRNGADYGTGGAAAVPITTLLIYAYTLYGFAEPPAHVTAALTALISVLIGAGIAAYREYSRPTERRN